MAKLDVSRVTYVAGVFDGRGTLSFSVDSSKSFIPSFQITHTNFDTLDYCWTTFGLGGISEIREGVWSWFVNNRSSILKILNSIHPYLITKHRVAAWMIEYLRSRSEHRYHNSPYNPRELEVIIRICEEKGRKKDSETLKVAREKMRKYYEW